MQTLMDEVKAAIAGLGLQASEASICDETESSRLMGAVQRFFVRGDPAQWWTMLRRVGQVIEYPASDGVRHILSHVPPVSGPVICILDSEGIGPSVALRCSLPVLPRILLECRFCEYYIVDPLMKWMVLENDHNEVIVAHAIEEGDGGDG